MYAYKHRSFIYNDHGNISIIAYSVARQVTKYRPISQTVFMLSTAINRAEHVCTTVIIKHNYMLMCNHKIVINIMLCLLNSTGHI